MSQLRGITPACLLALVMIGSPLIDAAEAQDAASRETIIVEPDIPGGQRDVDSDLQSTNSIGFVVIPGSRVTIDNGSSTRQVVVTFSAESLVSDFNDVFQLVFAIDGAFCDRSGGPELFDVHNFTGRFATRTAAHVFKLGPGIHSIRPCWSMLDDGDGIGDISVWFRSLTAEGRTK
jgi:hypothetical protein